MPVLTQGVRNGDEFPGDGGDDNLVRFSYLAEAICEISQAWVVMCRDLCRLEHHVPQGTATSGDGSFPAKGSAVVRDRGQSCEFMLSSFGCAVLQGRNQLFETMKSGGAAGLRSVVMPQGSDVAHHPVTDPGPGW